MLNTSSKKLLSTVKQSNIQTSIIPPKSLTLLAGQLRGLFFGNNYNMDQEFVNNRKIAYAQQYAEEAIHWFAAGYSKEQFIQARIDELKQNNIKTLNAYVKWVTTKGSKYAMPLYADQVQHTLDNLKIVFDSGMLKLKR